MQVRSLAPQRLSHLGRRMADYPRTFRSRGRTRCYANLQSCYGLGKPLDNLLLKVERAKKHILDLEAEYDRFHQTKPYTFSDSTIRKRESARTTSKTLNPFLWSSRSSLETPSTISDVLSTILHTIWCA